MPRPGKPWKRDGRPDWYATINGKQVNLGSDRKAAEREFHRLRASSKPLERSRLTVQELCEVYLAQAKIKPKTRESYQWYLQSWVDEAGKLRACELRPFHLSGWLQGHKWNSSTQHLAVSIVRLWSAWAKREGYLETDPLIGAKRPKMLRRKPVPPAQMDLFLQAIACPQFRDLVTVALDIGARPGETRTLEASRIDWDGSTAIVVGKTGERRLSLTQRAMDILRGHAEKYPSGPVLRNTRGGPWTDNAVRCQFARLSKRTGVKMTAYHTRHAFFQRAHSQGVSDIVIATQLGHTSLSMLMKTYAHVDTEMTKDAVEKAAKDPSRDP